MLKKSASGALASLRGSTYRSVRPRILLAAALLHSHLQENRGCLANWRGGASVGSASRQDVRNRQVQ